MTKSQYIVRGLVAELCCNDAQERVAIFRRNHARAISQEFELQSCWAGLPPRAQVFSHTDLGRKGDFPERFERIAELADVVMNKAAPLMRPGRSRATPF